MCILEKVKALKELFKIVTSGSILEEQCDCVTS